MKASLYITILIVFFSQHLYSQDLNFSVLSNIEMQINPATTTQHNGKWKISNNYRTQWTNLQNPLEGQYLSFSRKKYYEFSELQIGAFYQNYHHGSWGFYSDAIYGSVAYARQIDIHKIAVGMQIGGVRNGFSLSNATAPSQYDHFIGGYSNDLPHLEDQFEWQKLYADLHVGACWFYVSNFFESCAGISLSHFNRPNIGFGAEKHLLAIQKTLHANAKIRNGQKITLHPQLYVTEQSRAVHFVLGTDVIFGLSDEPTGFQNFSMGVFFRNPYEQNTNTLMYQVGASYKNLELKVNYDFALLKSQNFQGNNGIFEIAVSYTKPVSRLTKKLINCNRL